VRKAIPRGDAQTETTEGEKTRGGGPWGRKSTGPGSRGGGFTREKATETTADGKKDGKKKKKKNKPSWWREKSKKTRESWGALRGPSEWRNICPPRGKGGGMPIPS